jgi:hypothetical protein
MEYSKKAMVLYAQWNNESHHVARERDEQFNEKGEGGQGIQYHASGAHEVECGSDGRSMVTISVLGVFHDGPEATHVLDQKEARRHALGHVKEGMTGKGRFGRHDKDNHVDQNDGRHAILKGHRLPLLRLWVQHDIQKRMCVMLLLLMLLLLSSLKQV